MDSPRLLQQLLRAPAIHRDQIIAANRALPSLRPAQCLLQRRITPTTFHHHASTDSLPRVAQPSIWHSIVPRALRERRSATKTPKPPKSKEWNPATIFIILPLLVGSGAIQLLLLRTEMANFSRKTDAKIALLREVIERVKRGEEVDVEGLLGTGDPEREWEWEEVMREIEEEDTLWREKKTRRGKRAEEEVKGREEVEAVATKGTETGMGGAGEVEAEKRGPAGFY